jgi:hypothetical protein
MVASFFMLGVSDLRLPLEIGTVPCFFVNIDRLGLVVCLPGVHHTTDAVSLVRVLFQREELLAFLARRHGNHLLDSAILHVPVRPTNDHCQESSGKNGARDLKCLQPDDFINEYAILKDEGEKGQTARCGS